MKQCMTGCEMARRAICRVPMHVDMLRAINGSPCIAMQLLTFLHVILRFKQLDLAMPPPVQDVAIQWYSQSIAVCGAQTWKRSSIKQHAWPHALHHLFHRVKMLLSTYSNRGLHMLDVTYMLTCSVH